MSGWSNIVAIAAGANHTVGLRIDGTVVAVGYDFYSQVSAVNGWSSILSIAGGGDHTVGLGSDGTVVAVGRNSYSQVTGVNERFLGFLVQDADSDGQPDTCDTGDSDGDGLPDNIDPDPLAAPSFSDVTPTTYWSDFSGAATVADYDAEIGDIIAVFDPQGVACGKYVVDAAGQYGFLPAYGDDPDTQADEGAVAGDVLTFRVWDVSAQQELRATTTVVSGALPVVWQDQTISIVDINGLKNRTVSIPLRIGWNLVSIPLAMVGYVNAPPSAEVPINTRMEEVDSIDDIFASIAGQYSLIRSFDSFGAHTYDPDLPSFINTLKYVSGGYGYWFKMMEPGLLILNGPPQLPSDTLLLATGWNLVGCWGDVVKFVGTEPVYAYPGGGVSYSSVNSVSDILSSLSDNLNLVRSFDSDGAHTYDPLLPPFINTLSYMGPGYSYWIKLNAGAALQFGETQP